MGMSRRFASCATAGLALILTAAPALAQFSDAYTFLQGVKDRDGDKVQPLLDKPGAQLVNTRDPSTGESALHIVAKRHDASWLTFLLSRGAQPDAKDRQGNTPLMIAAQGGDTEEARLLLQAGANPNPINSSGETPLIRAVQHRDLAMVRLLSSNGADPAIRDTIAGKSAAEYAEEDPRATAVAQLLAAAKPKKPAANIAGPVR